jgi:hypothetical protein
VNVYLHRCWLRLYSKVSEHQGERNGQKSSATEYSITSPAEDDNDQVHLELSQPQQHAAKEKSDDDEPPTLTWVFNIDIILYSALHSVQKKILRHSLNILHRLWKNWLEEPEMNLQPGVYVTQWTMYVDICQHTCEGSIENFVYTHMHWLPFEHFFLVLFSWSYIFFIFSCAFYFK